MITHIIARLNIGGPAVQAIYLTHELEQLGYRLHLVRGVESPSEGNMDYLAAQLGVRPTLVPTLRRDPGLGDLRALVDLVRIVRRDRPAIVHTHAAKGGTLGRLATLLAFPSRRSRPVIIHTFHGHSLTGYFSGRTAGFYRRVEQVLARWTDVLVAVSNEVRDDLVQLGVAPESQFQVIPLGFDLDQFTDDRDRAARRAAVRGDWGAAEADVVVALIARVVPIKRVDMFLAMAAKLDLPGLRFVVVGDGELRAELEASPAARALGDRLVWAGFRRDIPEVCFASDIVALTSANEGTPVSLIEAQAAAVPVVATDVGGVRSAVIDQTTGYLVPADDTEGLATAVRRLAEDPELRSQLGAAGRAHATSLFTMSRVVRDHVQLYETLLGARAAARPAQGHA